MSDVFAVMADMQHMHDDLPGQPGPRGFILGTRFVAEF
mgnify:CR=1 FL=1